MALTKREVQQAAQTIKSLRQSGRRIFIRSGLNEETSFCVPKFAMSLLIKALEYMVQGNPVAIFPYNAEVTTQQAADLLNVSRPYIVKLVEEGRIPHRKVGSRRRILMADLAAYKNRDDQIRQRAIEQLIEEAQRLNLGY
ncbi:MAG: helix-turn-helix domain-containing protein [Candidatus Dormibacteraceae bacterium]